MTSSNFVLNKDNFDTIVLVLKYHLIVFDSSLWWQIISMLWN